MLGGLLLPWQPWIAWLHLPVVARSVAINLLGGACPFTPLEQRWRTAAGQAGYRGGFVAHYDGQLIYPAGMPRGLELVVVVPLPLWTALVYDLTTI